MIPITIRRITDTRALISVSFDVPYFSSHSDGYILISVPSDVCPTLTLIGVEQRFEGTLAYKELNGNFQFLLKCCPEYTFTIDCHEE